MPGRACQRSRRRTAALLAAALAIGCAPAREVTPPHVIASADGVASAGNDNAARRSRIDAPEAGAFEASASPSPELAGRWMLTHGGSPWIELEIAVHPGLSARVLSFDPSGSWTEFTVVRVKLGDDGALELTGQYTEFSDVVEIVLRLREGLLEGTAGGATYATPEPLLGRRRP